MNKYVLIRTEVGRDTIINTFASILNKTNLTNKIHKLLDELNQDNYYGNIYGISISYADARFKQFNLYTLEEFYNVYCRNHE